MPHPPDELNLLFPDPIAFIMEALYAPWRIEYILAPKPAPADAAVFREIGQSNDDEGNYVVARDRTCYAVLNRFPYTCGHLLVVHSYRKRRAESNLNDIKALPELIRVNK